MEHKLLNKIKFLQEKYPEDKFVLHDLYYDTVDMKNRANWNFATYIVPSFLGLFAYTTYRGPLPIFKRQCSVLGIHRIVKQYFVLGAICLGAAYYPLYKTVQSTIDKLNKVDEVKSLSDDGLIKPTYPFKFDGRNK